MSRLNKIRARRLARSLVLSPYTRCFAYVTKDKRTAGQDLREMWKKGRVWNVQTQRFVELDVRVLKSLQRLVKVARKRGGYVHINCLSNGFHSGGSYPFGCHPRGRAADIDFRSRGINGTDVRRAFASTGCDYVINEAGHWHGSWR